MTLDKAIEKLKIFADAQADLDLSRAINVVLSELSVGRVVTKADRCESPGCTFDPFAEGLCKAHWDEAGKEW